MILDKNNVGSSDRSAVSLSNLKIILSYPLNYVIYHFKADEKAIVYVLLN